MRPYRYPRGVDQAIRDYKRAAATTRTASGSAPPAAGAWTSGSGRFTQRLGRHNSRGSRGSAATGSDSGAWARQAQGLHEASRTGAYAGSVHGAHARPRHGFPAMYDARDQEANDLEFAHKLASEATHGFARRPPSHSPPNNGDIVFSDHADEVLRETLRRRTRRQRKFYAVFSPLANLLMIAGLVVSIALNSWSLVDVSENPWLGVGRQALLKAGANCTSCIINGEWWRLLTSLFIPAGVAQALFNGLLFSAAATVASKTGLSVWAFLGCTAAGGVIGSLTSAVAAQKTVHSTSSALPAASAAAAIIATLAVQRFLVSWVVVTGVLLAYLALLVVASFAPFADTWATAGGAVGGAVCAAAAMAPFFMRVRSTMLCLQPLIAASAYATSHCTHRSAYWVSLLLWGLCNHG
jgi:membrane associated rhomboid family serine protease